MHLDKSLLLSEGQVTCTEGVTKPTTKDKGNDSMGPLANDKGDAGEVLRERGDESRCRGQRRVRRREEATASWPRQLCTPAGSAPGREETSAFGLIRAAISMNPVKSRLTAKRGYTEVPQKRATQGPSRLISLPGFNSGNWLCHRVPFSSLGN